MKLTAYLQTLSVAQRKVFAASCGTTLGHLQNVGYGYKSCGERLAVAVERETGGRVKVETLCPLVDWRVIRGSSAAVA